MKARITASQTPSLPRYRNTRLRNDPGRGESNAMQRNQGCLLGTGRRIEAGEGELGEW